MICKRCGKNNAEVYYKQTINGKTSEYALCTHCAEELKKEGKLNISLPSLFDDFGFGVANDAFYGLNDFFGLQTPNKKRAIAEKKKCTLCSSTFDDLVHSGRVGCAKCYEVFEDELKNSIINIHGNSDYAGKRPKKYKIIETKQDKIKKLKAEMKNAIKLQEFEKAAEIRDAIKELEESEEN